MRKQFAVLALVVITGAAELRAGQTTGTLQDLHAGDQLRITDRSLAVVCGTLVEFSAQRLRLNTSRGNREWQIGEIRLIERRRPDPRWNGFLIGMLIGGAAGAIVGYADCPDDPECRVYSVPAFLFPGIGIGAAAGALIDFGYRKYDPLAGRTSGAFHFDPARRPNHGLKLSWRF